VNAGKEPFAWILNIGSELTLGITVNTNGAWIARKLSFLGFSVRRILCTPDDEEAIAVLREAIRQGVKLVVTTGGLGPTYDDRTLELVSRALERRLELNKDALKFVEEFYKEKGLALTEERIKMAYMPEGATALKNPIGAAPACIIKAGETTIICLPGVPKEMQAVFELHVEPLLKEMVPEARVFEAYLYVEGVPESSIAPSLKRLVREKPHLYVKTHPLGHEVKGPRLKIHFMLRGAEPKAKEELISAVEGLRQEAVKLGGSAVYELNYSKDHPSNSSVVRE